MAAVPNSLMWLVSERILKGEDARFNVDGIKKIISTLRKRLDELDGLDPQEAIERAMLVHNFNERDKYGRTVLSLLCQYAYEMKGLAKGLEKDLMKEAEKSLAKKTAEDLEELALYILENAPEELNVKLTDNFGRPCLHYAAELGNKKIVLGILERGAYVDWKNKSKQTAFHLAAKNGHIAILELLCQWGADINKEDSLSRNALFFAARGLHYESVMFLLAEGSVMQINLKNLKIPDNNKLKTVLEAAETLVYGTFDLAQDKKRAQEIFSVLGASINGKSWDFYTEEENSMRGQKTALHDIFNNITARFDLIANKMNEILRCKKIDSEALAKNARHELYLEKEMDFAIKLILQNPASIQQKDVKGWTPVDYYFSYLAKRTAYLKNLAELSPQIPQLANYGRSQGKAELGNQYLLIRVFLTLLKNFISVQTFGLTEEIDSKHAQEEARLEQIFKSLAGFSPLAWRIVNRDYIIQTLDVHLKGLKDGYFQYLSEDLNLIINQSQWFKGSLEIINGWKNRLAALKSKFSFRLDTNIQMPNFASHSLSSSTSSSSSSSSSSSGAIPSLSGSSAAYMPSVVSSSSTAKLPKLARTSVSSSTHSSSSSSSSSSGALPYLSGSSAASSSSPSAATHLPRLAGNFVSPNNNNAKSAEQAGTSGLNFQGVGL